MKIPLYENVTLKRDLIEHPLKKGDVAVLVECVPHPRGGEDGYVLEGFNAVGDSLTVVIVGESGVECLHAEEALAVRPLGV